MTGDLTVRNNDLTNTGRVNCRLWYNATPVGQIAVQDLAATGHANLAISNTFELAAGGSTTVSFRCYRQGVSTDVSYWYTNMTIFKVG